MVNHCDKSLLIELCSATMYGLDWPIRIWNLSFHKVSVMWKAFLYYDVCMIYARLLVPGRKFWLNGSKRPLPMQVTTRLVPFGQSLQNSARGLRQYSVWRGGYLANSPHCLFKLCVTLSKRSFLKEYRMYLTAAASAYLRRHLGPLVIKWINMDVIDCTCWD